MAWTNSQLLGAISNDEMVLIGVFRTMVKGHGDAEAFRLAEAFFENFRLGMKTATPCPLRLVSAAPHAREQAPTPTRRRKGTPGAALRVVARPSKSPAPRSL